MRLINLSRAIGLAMVAAVAALSAGSALATSHVARPTITAFLPSTASAGTNFVIAGKNLKGATTVTLSGVKVRFKVLADQAIRASVPKTAKTGKITVVTKAGSVTSTINFTVIPFRHA